MEHPPLIYSLSFLWGAPDGIYGFCLHNSPLREGRLNNSDWSKVTQLTSCLSGYLNPRLCSCNLPQYHTGSIAIGLLQTQPCHKLIIVCSMLLDIHIIIHFSHWKCFTYFFTICSITFQMAFIIILRWQVGEEGWEWFVWSYLLSSEPLIPNLPYSLFLCRIYSILLNSKDQDASTAQNKWWLYCSWLLILSTHFYFSVDAMKRVEEIKQKRQAKFIMNRYGSMFFPLWGFNWEELLVLILCLEAQ